MSLHARCFGTLEYSRTTVPFLIIVGVSDFLNFFQSPLMFGRSGDQIVDAESTWEVTLSESNIFLALFFVTDSSYYEEYFGRITFLICFLNRAERGEKRTVTR